ncbi:hypothetical protein CLOM_g1562 [Closterium sp. NIES-68]|nr:hypothetical protein CLOM_g9126 [Closterium sp. NIES-68]GJP41948.1 hypothetical protein CLOM_g1562 [Closterium sp. NIES-68]GJP81115.1 hypothetical protein CLOP_g11295 [Closterium sp. NIES-67]GJP85958.1 hypothetical protein CLOP_g16044 [Closterium sp. NIES-67]
MFFSAFFLPFIAAGVVACGKCRKSFDTTTAMRAHFDRNNACIHTPAQWPPREVQRLSHSAVGGVGGHVGLRHAPATVGSRGVDRRPRLEDNGAVPCNPPTVPTAFEQPDALHDSGGGGSGGEGSGGAGGARVAPPLNTTYAEVASDVADEASALPAFDTRREVFNFLKEFRNGVGMTQAEAKRFFRLINHPLFDKAEISQWKGMRDVERYACEVLGKHHGTWRKERVFVEGMTEAVELEYCDTLEALKDMFGNPQNSGGFKLHPETAYTEGSKRIFGRPETGMWWEAAQAALPSRDDVVAALIASSDVTHLSHNGRQKVWPLQISLANIPREARWKMSARAMVALLPLPDTDLPSEVKTRLFHACLDIVFAPLVKASKSSIAITDPFGVTQRVFPLMYAYVGDYPETCRVTGTMQHGCKMPCSLCQVPAELLDCLDRKFPWRTMFEQQQALASKERARNMGTHNVENVFWKWNHAKTEWGNPYQIVVPDVLHAVDIGIWKHILHQLVASCGASVLVEFDRRHEVLYKEARAAGLKLPKPGKYFQTAGCGYSASEHRAMIRPHHTRETLKDVVIRSQNLIAMCKRVFAFQKSHWKLVKMHLISHFPWAIMSRGIPEEYSTNTYEHSHTSLVKRPYRLSNRRQINSTIIAVDEVRRWMRALPSALQDDTKYLSAMKLAMETGRRTLTKASSAMVLELAAGHKRVVDDPWEKYNQELEGAMSFLPAAAAVAGVEAQCLQVHSALAIPAGDPHLGEPVENEWARATPSFHGKPCFSHVWAEHGGGPVLGKVLLFFHASGAPHAGYAFMRLLQVSGTDDCTGLDRFSFSADGAAPAGFAVVPLGNVKRVAHVVRSFKEPSEWLLNAYVF